MCSDGDGFSRVTDHTVDQLAACRDNREFAEGLTLFGCRRFGQEHTILGLRL